MKAGYLLTCLFCTIAFGWLILNLQDPSLTCRLTDCTPKRVHDNGKPTLHMKDESREHSSLSVNDLIQTGHWKASGADNDLAGESLTTNNSAPEFLDHSVNKLSI